MRPLVLLGGYSRIYIGSYLRIQSGLFDLAVNINKTVKFSPNFWECLLWQENDRLFLKLAFW